MTEDTRKPAEWLEDEIPGEVYIKPNLEMKLTDKQKKDCRDIVLEIKKFGINQRQLVFLIDLLALEIENMDSVRRIREVLRSEREKLPDAASSGLIIPKSDLDL